jgi:ATP-dependent helicase/nuclease subunit B
VALVGIIEFPPVLASLLGLLKNGPLIFIHAPEEEAAGFDEWGRLLPAHWHSRPCRFEDAEIHVVRDVHEQAVCCGEIIGAWRSRGIAESAITVAVPEAAALRPLLHGLQDAAIPVRAAEGARAARSAVLVLLAQLADYLDRANDGPPACESVAALARHPDLPGPVSVRRLDKFFNDHLPSRIDRELCDDESEPAGVSALLERISRLANIRSENFAADITALLLQLHGERRIPAHSEEGRMLVSALEAVRAALDEVENIPRDALAQFPVAELLRALVETAGAPEVPESEQPGAVELAGWLEAAGDDSPAMIVTSVFEGSLPEGAGTELLLPDMLREHLGLPSRASRFARDQYTLHCVWRSRRAGGRFALIAPRRRADGSAARPSRLLLGAHEDRELAARLLALARDAHQPGPPRQTARGLQPPEPDSEKMRAFRTFSVTSFRTYLASPRLFYFKHVLRLEAEDDSARELDAGAFGSLIHEALEAFGTRMLDSDAAPGEREIAEETIRSLHALTRRQFGRHPLPAVLAQMDSLEERLRAFAQEQAALFAEGWRIAHVEQGRAAQTALHVAGAPADVMLKGRIDRVDMHRDGRWRVIDYKTSSQAAKPTQAHYARNLEEWRDLQLPLYVKLLPALGIEGEAPPPGERLELVYFNLPPRRDDAGISEPFDPALVEAAWRTAEEIVREVCSGAGCRDAGELWRGEDPVFTALCGLNGLPGLSEED